MGRTASILRGTVKFEKDRQPKKPKRFAAEAVVVDDAQNPTVKVFEINFVDRFEAPPVVVLHPSFQRGANDTYLVDPVRLPFLRYAPEAWRCFVQAYGDFEFIAMESAPEA